MRKHSTAHYWNKPEAGTGWNQLERAKRQRELNCGFTLFGWDGDTLARESSPAQDEGDTGKTVHYLYEPGSFVPVAQALRKAPIQLSPPGNIKSGHGPGAVHIPPNQVPKEWSVIPPRGLNHHNR